MTLNLFQLNNSIRDKYRAKCANILSKYIPKVNSCLVRHQERQSCRKETRIQWNAQNKLAFLTCAHFGCWASDEYSMCILLSVMTLGYVWRMNKSLDRGSLKSMIPLIRAVGSALRATHILLLYKVRFLWLVFIHGTLWQRPLGN